MLEFKKVLICLVSTFVTCGTDMNVFDQMMESLAKEAFKDYIFKPISEEKFQEFLKDATFEKLKGRKLGEIFAEKFNIRDRALSMFSEDKDVISHIRYCKYVK